MHCAPAQSHDPHAERNIRTIKERVRAIIHFLPYKQIPKTVKKYIVMEEQITLITSHYDMDFPNIIVLS